MQKVAVGIVFNDKQQILLTKRADYKHEGGLWEFPGGKFEEDEQGFTALQRELQEEVNIKVEKAYHFASISHDYPDISVLLECYKVMHYQNEVKALENQEYCWVNIQDLEKYSFPKANQKIIEKLLLSDRYLITGKFNDDNDFLDKLEKALQRGIRLIQLRISEETWPEEIIILAKKAIALAHQYQAKVLINQEANMLTTVLADGLHLNSKRLYAHSTRPIPDSLLLSASCHTKEDIQQAKAIQADFILLSPVLPTKSHPEAQALGWDSFSDIIQQAGLPVYALGGMKPEYTEIAKRYGAQGIAAISSLWE